MIYNFTMSINLVIYRWNIIYLDFFLGTYIFRHVYVQAQFNLI